MYSNHAGDKEWPLSLLPVTHSHVLDICFIMSGLAVLFVDPAKPSRDQSVHGFPLIFHLKGSREMSLLISVSALGVGLNYSHETLSCVRHF